jgi:prolyl 4-hydroxylase
MKKETEIQIVSPSFIGMYQMQDTKICDAILKYYNDNPKLHVQGRVGKKVTEDNTAIDYYAKKSTDLAVKPNHKLLKDYFKFVQQCLNLYCDQYKFVNDLQRFDVVEDANIQHYGPMEGFYNWHCERDSDKPPFGSRCFVYMTYLNDVPNAGTQFYYQNLTASAKKGLTLIFPSDWTHTHKGQISTEHDKYIITGWYSYIK